MLRIIEIRKGDIRKKTAEYKWTHHAVEAIKQIAHEWLDAGFAQSVLLFFKDAGGELHAYMPLIPIDKVKRPAVHDIPGAINDASMIIGIEPYPVKESKLAKEDISAIVRIMGQEHYWNGNEVFRMSEQGNIQEFEIDTQVKWETIKYGRDRIRAVKKVTGKAPGHLVRAVESMQREYDEQTGFAECQLESHAFAIKLEGLFNKGRFVAKDLIRLIENQLDLFNIVSPGEHKPFTVHLAAFVPGSSCLVGDYDIAPDIADEKTDKTKVRESIATAEERMSAIVQAAPVLVDKSKPPAQRVKEFKEISGLSNTEAYAAMHDISKLRAANQTIKLYSNHPTSKKETQAEMDINGSAIAQIAEIKRTLATLIEPENTTQLTGKIVELDHYKDDDLKFGIYVEDEARLYTIHYPDREDMNIKAKKGTIVSLIVIRERVNKPWYFSEWKK